MNLRHVKAIDSRRCCETCVSFCSCVSTSLLSWGRVPCTAKSTPWRKFNTPTRMTSGAKRRFRFLFVPSLSRVCSLTYKPRALQHIQRLLTVYVTRALEIRGLRFSEGLCWKSSLENTAVVCCTTVRCRFTVSSFTVKSQKVASWGGGMKTGITVSIK